MIYSTNLHEAKTHLSKWVNLAVMGEEVIICENGKPLVRLVPFTDDKHATPRKPGLLKGKITIRDDFDTLPNDLKVL